MLAEDPDVRKAFRRFLPRLRPYRRILAAALLATVASTGAVVAVAPVIGRGVDAVINHDRAGLAAAVGVLILLVVARLLLLRWSELLLTRAGERVVRDLRDLAVERLAAAPLRFVETHRTGDLLRRATGEIADLALFVRDQLPNLLGLGLTIMLTAAVLVAYSWMLASILVLLFLPAAFAVIRWFNRGAPVVFGRQAAADATMTATFTEALAASEALVVAGRADEWVNRFRRDNGELLRASNRAVAVQNRLELFSLLEGMATAALLLLSVWLVRAGHVGIGTIVVFVIATRNLFEGLLGLSRLAGELQTVRVGLARLTDLLDVTRPEPGARPESGVTLPARADLVADGLRFGYLPGQEVLRGVSVGFPAGDRSGMVGATGSGKTTLAKVLSGLYEPDEGAVRFGDVDLRTVPAEQVRQRIVLIPQQVHMITGTLAENLALTPGEPPRAAMERAVEQLGLSDWVAGIPGGLDADIGSRGERLSAGERQIVGLLRAALVNPPVLLLDEATADLDPDVARRLETAVERLRAGRTLIVIAHRAATIERLPRVVRLAAGELV